MNLFKTENIKWTKHLNTQSKKTNVSLRELNGNENVRHLMKTCSMFYFNNLQEYQKNLTNTVRGFTYKWFFYHFEVFTKNSKIDTENDNYLFFVAGSFKSRLIDYFRGCIVSWEKVEGSIWQFYDN